ncbi:MAG: hypothetical protein IJN78_00075 [Clostridia bacterium]|nr:hypothetical protein [Clostridia bacterium]MBQ7042983.1 hypothetical protein [Clostridia bacterium]
MKKLTKIFAMLLIACCLLFAFGCSDNQKKVNTPQFDFATAEKNLVENGYRVEITDNPSLPFEAYSSCSSLYAVNNAGDYIMIIKFESEEAAKDYMTMLELLVEAETEYYRNSIKIYEYILDNKKESLTEAEIIEYEETIKDLKKANKELRSDLKKYNFTYKYVWYGTENAINATK